MICYSMYCVETFMNLVFDSTKVKWFALYHTNQSHKVPLSFVWLKFSSFGWDVDMRRIRSDKSLSLGMPKAPQGNIQGRSKQLSLGMHGRHPLFHLRSSVTLLGAIFLFTTWYVFCLERLVLYESLLILLFSLSQSSLLNTFVWESHTHIMIC